MRTPADVHPRNDLTPAGWLLGDLGWPTGTVADLLPPAYDAHVRVPRSLGPYDDPEQRPTLLGLRDVLARHTADAGRCWFTFWVGFPLPRAWARTPRLAVPARDQLLFDGRLDELEVICAAFGQVGYDEPTLWWPDDRAWVAHWDVDSDAAYVACSDQAAVELVGAGLEAHRVDLGDAVTIEE